MSAAGFNFNAYDNALALLRFPLSNPRNRTKHGGLYWLGLARSRNRYRCDATTATCIVLLRHATTFRWEDQVVIRLESLRTKQRFLGSNRDRE
jgi:hypothetical protein